MINSLCNTFYRKKIDIAGLDINQILYLKNLNTKG